MPHKEPSTDSQARRPPSGYGSSSCSGCADTFDEFDTFGDIGLSIPRPATYLESRPAAAGLIFLLTSCSDVTITDENRAATILVRNSTYGGGPDIMQAKGDQSSLPYGV